MDDFIADPFAHTTFRTHLEMNTKFDEICGGCANIRNFIIAHQTIKSDVYAFGIPGVGTVDRKHYSWYPTTSDPSTLFGSRIFELNKQTFPLQVWSEDVVLGKNGPKTEIIYPVPCGECKTFTRQMYVYKAMTESEKFRCSCCVPRVFEAVSTGWNEIETFEEFGVLVRLGTSSRHVVWTTGWTPELRSDFSSLRESSPKQILQLSDHRLFFFHVLPRLRESAGRLTFLSLWSLIG